MNIDKIIIISVIAFRYSSLTTHSLGEFTKTIWHLMDRNSIWLFFCSHLINRHIISGRHLSAPGDAVGGGVINKCSAMVFLPSLFFHFPTRGELLLLNLQIAWEESAAIFHLISRHQRSGMFSLCHIHRTYCSDRKSIKVPVAFIEIAFTSFMCARPTFLLCSTGSNTLRRHWRWWTTPLPIVWLWLNSIAGLLNCTFLFRFFTTLTALLISGNRYRTLRSPLKYSTGYKVLVHSFGWATAAERTICYREWTDK